MQPLNPVFRIFAEDDTSSSESPSAAIGSPGKKSDHPPSSATICALLPTDERKLRSHSASTTAKRS